MAKEVFTQDRRSSTKTTFKPITKKAEWFREELRTMKEEVALLADLRREWDCSVLHSEFRFLRKKYRQAISGGKEKDQFELYSKF